MNKLILNTAFITLLLFQACSSKVYNNKAYLHQASIEGKKVAILPAEVELTGRMPSNFSNQKKVETEDSESKIIQNEIYSQYLFKSKSGSKKKAAVELMNVDQVNSRLQQAGISLRDSWNMDPDSLGKMLGVDLVLKVRVKKNRIMSETAAFGIGVAGTVLGNILNNNNQNTSVGSQAKTYNMFLEATLSDVNSHAVITRFSHKGDASWNHPPEAIIESSGRKIVRKGVVYAQQ